MKMGQVGLGFQEVPSDVKAETLLSWSALEKGQFPGLRGRRSSGVW